MDRQKLLDRYRNKSLEKYPETMEAIRKYSEQFSEPHKPKYYYLISVKSKKYGFLWYVRYVHNGKPVYSRWCTHTNNREAAERFAVENRERILNEYFGEKDVKKHINLFGVLKTYYSKDSPCLLADAKRGRIINEASRIIYHNFIIKQFIPYLKRKQIKEIGEIDVTLLDNFRDYLLSDKKRNGKTAAGVKPQTVAHGISTISTIFDRLIIEGYAKTNPCKSLQAIKTPGGGAKPRGCYEITQIKGVFNKKWENNMSYLLNLVIYTTGIRNSELERLKAKDIITAGGLHFINIPQSKTMNGVRIVPLHDFVYRKLGVFIKKNGRDGYIFFDNGKSPGSRFYNKANLELAQHTKYTREQLESEYITFYSGRHFWKTLMDSESLGDIEEYFMGHRVSANVAKNYNHKDRQGKIKLLEKTKKVFEILDKYVFA